MIWISKNMVQKEDAKIDMKESGSGLGIGIAVQLSEKDKEKNTKIFVFCNLYLILRFP